MLKIKCKKFNLGDMGRYFLKILQEYRRGEDEITTNSLPARVVYRRP